MATDSLSKYLGAWEMLATNGKPLSHLEPIVKELEALIAEARELEGLVQESAKEGLVPSHLLSLDSSPLRRKKYPLRPNPLYSRG